jgi:hypothetical protein
VLALLGVFVYHTLCPFDTGYWHVKSVHRSQVLTDVLAVIGSWGLAFFFLIAGASTFLALRWRTPMDYVGERVLRLAVPLAAGWAVLGPVQLWLEEHHHHTSDDSLAEVTLRHLSDPFAPPPNVMNHTYALWFLVFLLEYSLLGLPIFVWLRHRQGQRALARLGRLGRRRGGVLLLFVPVAGTTLPLAWNLLSEEHGWGQFVYLFAFFVLGYVVMAAPGLVDAVRRDIGLAFTLAIGGVVAIFVLNGPEVLEASFGSWTWLNVLILVLVVAQAWGWVLGVWAAGMRFTAFARPLPRLVAAAAMPFFLLHQPVILAVAFVAVRLGWGIPATWLAIALPAFVVTAVLSCVLSQIPGVGELLGVKRRPSSATGPTVANGGTLVQ